MSNGVLLTHKSRWLLLHSWEGVGWAPPQLGREGVGWAPPQLGREGAGGPPQLSLVALCARVIVRDRAATRRAVLTAPRSLCYDLMRAALRDGRELAVAALLSAWPAPSLCLATLAPQLTPAALHMYDEAAAVTRWRHALRCTTVLAHMFVECLKLRSPTRLRCLDLTGFLTAEVIVNYLASHVMLVHNETRQQEIIARCNELTEGVVPYRPPLNRLQTTLPDDTFVVRVDTFVDKDDSHIELCRALRVSQLTDSGFKVTVHHLDLSSMAIARVIVLLEQINQQDLRALCLQYTGLAHRHGLQLVSDVLVGFQGLVALDLSSNCLQPSTDVVTRRCLAGTLSRLPSLRRLDLSNNRLRLCLSDVLCRLPQPLSCLRVCACCLRPDDLQYLVTSPHATSLCWLDVSENCLGGLGGKLATLLGRAPLTVLETEDCRLTSADLQLMCEAVAPHLSFWNLALNAAVDADSLPHLLSCAALLPALEALRVSVPPDPTDFHGNDPVDLHPHADEVTFRHDHVQRKFQVQLETLCTAASRPAITLVMC